MFKPQTHPALIRAVTQTDIPAIHRVHQASIRGLCTAAYAPDLIEQWASNPDLKRYEKMLAPDTRAVLAIANHEICAFGSVELTASRLASLFVYPGCAGTGVGRLLLQRLEQIARNAGLATLQVQASLNAREFYARHGYRFCRLAKHRMSSGMEIDCAEMQKTLDT